jgi:hypothetical protein
MSTSAGRALYSQVVQLSDGQIPALFGEVKVALFLRHALGQSALPPLETAL